MPITQKLTEEEFALIEILRHPLFFAEFMRNYDLLETDPAWEYTDYQKDFICDFNHFVSIVCARATGKTVAIVDKLLWLAINNFWDNTIVYTVPNRVHLEPVFLRVSKWFRHHSFFKWYSSGRGINSQTFTIKLLNGGVIDCRIAGTTGTGANVIGLHIPFIILDEGGFYPWGTFVELLPTLNLWDEGYQLIISGVPTGVREKNVLYTADIRDEKYTKHRITAHRNPRYSKEDDERNIKQYGGLDSEEYVHLVLAKHGDPAYTLFERSRMLVKDYAIFKGSVLGQKLKGDPGYLNRFYSALPALPKSATSVAFGIDLGYTEPTVIMVMYRNKDSVYWRFLARVTLRQVGYPEQERIIDHMDSMYSPRMVAVDEGSSGKAVIQHMVTDPLFRHKNYKERLIPINFASNIPIGLDDDGEEVTVKAKQFGMQLLQNKVNNHNICFTWADESLISELERTTYRRSQSGVLVYRTITARGGLRHGEDHNTSAMLCFVLGLYLTDEASQFLWKKRVNLYRPRWHLL